jgi:hypothetical protein
MLPMILGFLGSAFAPALAGATGIAALASPLLAGSIGTGLGTAIQQKDLGAGLKAGLGSFVGGKLVGGLMGSTAGGAMAQPLPGQGVMGTGANAMTTGTPLTSAIMPPVSTGSAGLFGSGAIGRGMQFAQSPTGIGALMGASLATPAPTVELPDETSSMSTAEMVPIPRQARFPGEEYMPGVSPEFDYGVSTPYSYADIAAYRDRGVLPYAEGGKAEIEMDDETGAMEVETKRPVAGNEKTEIVDAISAIKGTHPQPEIALGKFLAKYGEDALRDLVDSVQSGEFDETVGRFANGEKGAVRGPGDGTGVDDKVPATIDGEQDVLLADGEFVLRKDATDALEKKFGGGFLSSVNDAGPKAAETLKQRIAA